MAQQVIISEMDSTTRPAKRSHRIHILKRRFASHGSNLSGEYFITDDIEMCHKEQYLLLIVVSLPFFFKPSHQIVIGVCAGKDVNQPYRL